jgi:HK97 family phage major capsid protein
MEDVVTEDQLTQLKEHTEQLNAATKALEVFEDAEKATMIRLDNQIGKDVEKETEVKQAVKSARIELRSTKQKGWAVMTGLACMFKGHVEQQPALTYANAIKDHPEVDMFIRAAVNPADTATAGWASELVQDTWGEFIELIRDVSVYPNVLGPRMPFDQYGKIHLPKNDGRGTLAGDFVAENGWIPVKEGLTGITDMTPKDIGVISTFSKKLARHSVPQIEQLIRTQFLGDTAEVLDTRFMDATARSATRPAGLQDTTETGAGNINASTGATVAAIEADVQALLGRVYTARLGMRGQWLMSRLRTLGLSKKQDAASGMFVYKAEIAAGMFSNYPVVESMNMPDDVVAFVSDDSIGHGEAQAPEITTSDSTALHIDDAPTGPPNWSAFQTNSVAIKLDLGLDWRIYRQGGVQVLTGVAW